MRSTIRIAETDEEIGACFPVMSELRPKLKAEDFVATIRAMEDEGMEDSSLHFRIEV